MTIPQIPQNLGNLVKLREFLDSFRSEIVTSSIYAADRIVSLAADEGTDLTIQAAIDNLPAAGGSIFIKAGTYPVSTTIVLPNKPVKIVGAGEASVIDIGSSVIAAFTVPNGLTAARRFDFKSFYIKGNNVVGQEAVRYADANNRGDVYLEDVKITDIETIANWTAYNYSRQSLFNALRCWISQSSNTNPVLAKTPSPANTYSGTVGVKFFDCILDDPAIAYGSLRSWTAEVDGDFWLSDISTLRMRAGSFNSNGFEAQRSVLALHKNSPAADVNFYGNGWDNYNYIQDCTLYTYDLGATFSSFPAHRLAVRGARWFLGNITFGGAGNPGILVASTTSGSGTVVSGCWTNSGASPALEIASDNCRVIGLTAISAAIPGSAAILLNGVTRTVVDGCVFIMTGTQKTIQETGAADYNLVSGCNGIATGGGFSIPGANSLVGADNIG
jgi:hypothetical protein